MDSTNGKLDARNQLNDLTGKEWIKSTKSFFFSEKCADDKAAFAHPAPFLIKDIEKMIAFFTKKRHDGFGSVYGFRNNSHSCL